MLQLYSFAAVKTTGVRIYKKLRLLLAVMLCCVLACAKPVVAQAAQHEARLGQTPAVDAPYDAPFSFAAGELSPGAPEGMLQVDKVLLTPLLKQLIRQLYASKPVAKNTSQFVFCFSGTATRYSILTKGP